jgi:hypothetical protein
MREAKRKQIRNRTILVDVFGLVNLLYLFCKFFNYCDLPGLEIVSGVFIISLVSYIKKKEEVKALGLHTRKRRGEMWVFLWWFSAIVMIMINSFFPGKFVFPREELGILLPVIWALYLETQK